MARYILALNVGSTTLKGAVYGLEAAAEDQPPVLTEHARAEVRNGFGLDASLAALLAALSAPDDGPEAVVHRVVHGGDYTHGVELDEAVLARLAALTPLAPLHQPTALALVRLAREKWPEARHGVAFDTSFHATLAPWSRRLPIPAEWDAMGVRRYGFHGLAFASALKVLAAHNPAVLHERVVLAHLGGGCSVCAVQDGTSRDTTMAFTPLSGVPGPTRSGDLDPGALLYLLRQPGLTEHVIEDRLSHQAGLAGIAGHGDMRLLLGDDGPSAQLSVDLFVVRIAQSIAAMATGIGGLAHLVLSGGIANRSPHLRTRIIERLAWLGLALDPRSNDSGTVRIDSGVGPAIWNVMVDEERELAESALPWLCPPGAPLARRARASGSPGDG